MTQTDGYSAAKTKGPVAGVGRLLGRSWAESFLVHACDGPDFLRVAGTRLRHQSRTTQRPERRSSTTDPPNAKNQPGSVNLLHGAGSGH